MATDVEWTSVTTTDRSVAWQRRWLWLAMCWLICAVYMYLHLMRGWIPHDEGDLALPAQQILQGKIPHKDFDEAYTGGLSYVHALAFQLLGIKLTSLRWAVFSVFLFWVVAVFVIANRFAAPIVAAGLTILCAAWSLPNYAASQPAWYNLFFATFGTWAALRFLESKKRRWLLLAGLFAGTSICIKITGLYFAAAALIFLVYCQQDTSEDSSSAGRRWTALAIGTCGAGALFAFLLFQFIRPLLSFMFFAHFVFPGVVLASVIVWREFSSSRSASLIRLRGLIKILFPFLAGLLVPCGILLLPYLKTNSVGALFHGVLASRSHIQFAAKEAVETGWTGFACLAILVLAVGASIVLPRVPKLLTPLLGLAGLLAVVASDRYVPLYRDLWFAVSSLVPFTVFLGCYLLERSRQRGEIDSNTAQKTFLLIAVVALCSLVQFPFAAPIYFCYVAPLLWLSLLALRQGRGRVTNPLGLTLGALALLFVVMRVTPGFIIIMGEVYEPDEQNYVLHLERTGPLRVSPEDGRGYEELITAVRKLSGKGNIYAGPDSPEIYFLAGKPNLTGMLFDFYRDPEQRDQAIRRVLEDASTRVAIIRSSPDFSDPLSPELYDLARRRYPWAYPYGPFELRWR
jgi:hypothetical protein